MRISTQMAPLPVLFLLITRIQAETDALPLFPELVFFFLEGRVERSSTIGKSYFYLPVTRGSLPTQKISSDTFSPLPLCLPLSPYFPVLRCQAAFLCFRFFLERDEAFNFSQRTQVLFAFPFLCETDRRRFGMFPWLALRSGGAPEMNPAEADYSRSLSFPISVTQ